MAKEEATQKAMTVSLRLVGSQYLALTFDYLLIIASDWGGTRSL